MSRPLVIAQEKTQIGLAALARNVRQEGHPQVRVFCSRSTANTRTSVMGLTPCFSS
jgi:hypothetical protein